MIKSSNRIYLQVSEVSLSQDNCIKIDVYNYINYNHALFERLIQAGSIYVIFSGK